MENLIRKFVRGQNPGQTGSSPTSTKTGGCLPSTFGLAVPVSSRQGSTTWFAMSVVGPRLLSVEDVAVLYAQNISRRPLDAQSVSIRGWLMAGPERKKKKRKSKNVEEKRRGKDHDLLEYCLSHCFSWEAVPSGQLSRAGNGAG
jgi:hypothetical protein